jgi:hypothetical protein
MVSFRKIKSNLKPGFGYESVFLIQIQQLVCGSTSQMRILLYTQSTQLIKQTRVSLPTSAMGKRISSGSFLQFYFDRHIGSPRNPHYECGSVSRILCNWPSRKVYPYRLPVWERGPLPASWRDSPDPRARSGSGGSPRRRSYSWPCPHTCISFRAYIYCQLFFSFADPHTVRIRN